MNALLPYETAYWNGFATHPASACSGRPCPVHNPSNHHMRSWALNYRFDRNMTERICPTHNVGHPDPDDPTTDRVHGCCGCCSVNTQATETPRCNAAEDREDGSISPEFARQLENELNAADAQIAVLRQTLEAVHAAILSDRERLTRVQQKLGIDTAPTLEQEELFAAIKSALQLP